MSQEDRSHFGLQDYDQRYLGGRVAPQLTHFDPENSSDVLHVLVHSPLHIVLGKCGKVDLVGFLLVLDGNVEWINIHLLFGWGRICWIVSYCALQLERLSGDTHLDHSHPLIRPRPHRSNHHRRRSIRSQKT